MTPHAQLGYGCSGIPDRYHEVQDKFHESELNFSVSELFSVLGKDMISERDRVQ